MSRAEFEEIVADAIDAIPARLWDMADNVAVLVEDEPPAGVGEILGLYEGVPRTERTWSEAAFLPDRITVYRGPSLRAFPDDDELRRQVRITVVHELAHHLGIDEERLARYGWD